MDKLHRRKAAVSAVDAGPNRDGAIGGSGSFL
jgi:hypothetical protein